MASSDDVKTTCPHCGGNIEFPAEAVGQAAPCPHCGVTIQLCSPPIRTPSIKATQIHQDRGTNQLEKPRVFPRLHVIVGGVFGILTGLYLLAAARSYFMMREFSPNLPRPPLLENPILAVFTLILLLCLIQELLSRKQRAKQRAQKLHAVQPNARAVSKEYYVLLDGAECGPYTFNQLRAMWNNGKLTAKTRFCIPGMDEWRNLSTMMDLLEPEGSYAGANTASWVAPMPQPTGSRPSGTLLVKSTKSRGIYIILGLFLGPFGIHNFYAGHYKNGVAQLVVLVFLGWLLFIGVVINAIWVLVELFTVTVDGNGDPMT